MTTAPPGGILVPLGNAPWTKQRYLLRHDKMTLGRGRDCDVHLPIPTVSRLHAELRWQGDRLILEHRSQTNATVVNNFPITTSVELRSGDVVEIADSIAFRVELFDLSDDHTTEAHDLASRRMCAVLVADVAGYARLMERSETRTVAQFRACLEIFERQVSQVGGRLINVAGDGVIATFINVLSGLRCAIGIQRRLRELSADSPEEQRMRFRMGFNAGDVVFDTVSGVHGDAVNLAARLEQMAPPGEIYVSGATVDQVHDFERDLFSFVREEQPKNMSRVIQIYQVALE
jgi:class 3 adenylate cyclase